MPLQKQVLDLLCHVLGMLSRVASWVVLSLYLKLGSSWGGAGSKWPPAVINEAPSCTRPHIPLRNKVNK